MSTAVAIATLLSRSLTARDLRTISAPQYANPKLHSLQTQTLLTFHDLPHRQPASPQVTGSHTFCLTL